MSRIKATVRYLHARRHADEVAREVEAELRFHIQMRTRANIEGGMRPAEAQRAARQSFGNFDQVKTECCEISRSLPVDSNVLKMASYITIAILAGAAALWAVTHAIASPAFRGRLSPLLFWLARSSPVDAHSQESIWPEIVRAALLMT